MSGQGPDITEENMSYESIIGLEVHAQLATSSKIFCGCSTEYGKPPNSLTCPVCLGMPGVLPVLNKKAVEYAIKMILAVEGKINSKSIFARKNYFYPDLPKGYQISQYQQPLGTGGHIEIQEDNKKRKIGITRIHLEEDAGKSLHSEDEDESLIDMNRCGVPLIEIVSEPEINSTKEAYLYLQKLKQILEYLRICSGDMEKGNLRCDANVSVRKKGQKDFGVKTEVKNMNSFKGVEKALSYEIDRQIRILEKGEKIEQETLLWDEKKQTVVSMRGKEQSQDYRYFPEPDLVTLSVSREWIEEVKKDLPELPNQRRKRLAEQYKIPQYDAGVLTMDKKLADYFEESVGAYNQPKRLSNWIMGDVLRELGERKIQVDEFSKRVSPAYIANLQKAVDSGELNLNQAKEMFKKDVLDIFEKEEMARLAQVVILEKQITDKKEIEKAVDEVLSENPDNIKRYKAGEEKLFYFFVGQVMKKTGGKANPKLVNKILKEKLSK